MIGREVVVAAQRPYRVHVGPGLLHAAASLGARRERCALICDAKVLELHGQRLSALDGAPRLALPPGEESKTLANVERALEFLADSGLDRRGLVVTLGGGMISDLGGLAASLYMRGVDVVHCPTTLLAQVDAATGGKTAINLRAGKNLAGSFHQPLAVFADTSTLSTLPPEDLRSGLGEVVKAALLGAWGLLPFLEHHAEALGARDADALTEAVTACVSHKAQIVAADERDFGGRRALNLGHTFGHAIEHAAGYGRIPHGVAVAVGLMCALEASSSLGVLSDSMLLERTRHLMERLGLPPSLSALRRSSKSKLAPEVLIGAMSHDKKGSDGEIALVLLRRVGEPLLDVRPGAAFLQRLLARA